MFDKYCVLRPK